MPFHKILEKEIRRLKEENEFLEEASAFFAASRHKVKKGERVKFIAQKLSDGKNKRKLSLYCRVLRVSRQGLYDYLERRDRPWKYAVIAMEMRAILEEDKENDTYGRKRMYEALKLRNTEGADGSIRIPSDRTVYRIMK